jgi:hypothetical protein
LAKKNRSKWRNEEHEREEDQKEMRANKEQEGVRV